MDNKQFHPIIRQKVAGVFNLDEQGAVKFLDDVVLVSETQRFLKYMHRLPTKSFTAAVGFVDSYFGRYPYAACRDCGRNVFELVYYQFSAGIREGVGIAVKNDVFDVFKIENVNGQEVVHLTKNIQL